MITIRDASGLQGRIIITYNPLSDLMLALDLLSSPERQPIHTEWADDVLNSLSRRDKIKLTELKEFLGRYLKLDNYLIDLPIVSEDPIDEFESHIRDRKNWEQAKDDYNPDDFIPFITYMWITYIKPVVTDHWSAIKQQMIEGNYFLETGNYVKLLESISERVKINKDTLKIQKWLEIDVSSSDIKTFNISPSIFLFPYLVMDWREDEGYFYLGWETPFKGNDTKAKGIDVISSRAFALSDKSRLRMLLVLNKSPMTQKELGEFMGFAKSTTSKHVNLLVDSGILIREEVDRTVFLKLNKDQISGFSDLITNWLM